MKKNFEGVQIDAQYCFDNHQNDNARRRRQCSERVRPANPEGHATAAASTTSRSSSAPTRPDDKGNITAYATYRHTEAILAGHARLRCLRHGHDDGPDGDRQQLHTSASGSSNSAYGRFDRPHRRPGEQELRQQPERHADLRALHGALAFNFDPLNFLQREDDRYTAGFFAHYDVNKAIEVYSDFMFTDDQTNAQIAPSGLFRSSGPNLSSGYTINCNNPLLSAPGRPLLCGPAPVITPTARRRIVRTTCRHRLPLRLRSAEHRLHPHRLQGRHRPARRSRQRLVATTSTASSASPVLDRRTSPATLRSRRCRTP